MKLINSVTKKYMVNVHFRTNMWSQLGSHINLVESFYLLKQYCSNANSRLFLVSYCSYCCQDRQI